MNSKNEIWKDIPDYEGHYQVSDFGRVRSIHRLDSIGRKRKGRLMNQAVTKNKRQKPIKIDYQFCELQNKQHKLL